VSNMGIIEKFQETVVALILITLLSTFPLQADDFFCENPDQTVKLHAFIPLSSSGSLVEYLKTNESGRINSLRTLTQLAAELSEKSGEGLKATAEFLSFINGYYDYMVEASSNDIGKLLSEQIIGTIDENYRKTNTPSRKLEFVTTNLYRGNQEIYSQINSLPDFAAYGNYNYIADQKVSISLNIIRISDGATRTFVSTGNPINAAVNIGNRVFDAIQFPTASDIFNPFSNIKWIGSNSNQAPANIRLSESLDFCASFGARLPTKLELLIADQLGPYISGVRISASEKYAVIDGDKVSYFTPKTGECFEQTSDKTITANVYCLKGK